MRGVTTIEEKIWYRVGISTHTPHARRDAARTSLYFIRRLISTHTPHARRDYRISDSLTAISTFQLTRLMRGVTLLWTEIEWIGKYFNSHASCEA